MSETPHRLRFAARYALRHLLLSLLVACVSASLVYGLLYTQPWHAMLGVSSIFLLLLVVDVVCGPLLTLILASPEKPKRERWLDFSLVGVVQLAALFYGVHSLWLGRPVILAFEVDQLVIASAVEIQTEKLQSAPEGLQHLPWWGVLKVGTRKAENGNEFIRSVMLSLEGISPAMRPDWWQPWETAQSAINERAKPITELQARRPQDAATLQTAIAKTGLPADQLRYLPLTSSKTKEWIALLDQQSNIVGYAPVDGF